MSLQHSSIPEELHLRITNSNSSVHKEKGFIDQTQVNLWILKKEKETYNSN
jgi:hypothetical protein